MATLTITTTAAQDARIADAFGKHLHLGRNATGAEVKAEVINYVRSIVFDQERLAVIEANPPSALDPT